MIGSFKKQNRSIIHINVADFAVAVERLADARLKNRPVVIAPEAAARATVYDMSEEAYQAGIRKGMALRQARRLCHQVHVLPPHTARYEQAMAALMRQALPFSPLIERGEDDGHLFVDVSGTSRLFGPAVDVAWRMRQQARKALGLDPIWSLATNKLVAKVASRLVKPLGEYIVPAGDEAAFLAPLPVWLIPGLERRDLIRLGEFNLTRVHQVTALNTAHLETALGQRADFVASALRGADTAPVLPMGQGPLRVVHNHTFGTDTNAPAAVEGVLYALVEKAGLDLRRQGRAARRACIAIDYSDGRRCVRQTRIKPATANDLVLFPFARRALNLAWQRRVRLRHLRLTLDRLAYPPAQMPLFDDERQAVARQENLVAVMDKVRNRFGSVGIQMGRSLGALQ